MYPSQHLFLGIIFALTLFYFFPVIGTVGILMIILSTFFVDVDHYFLYVYDNKSLSLVKAYKWFRVKLKKRLALSYEEKLKYKYEILIFHGIEFWAILFTLGFFSKIFMFFFIGVMFHMFLDFIALIYYDDIVLLKTSVIYNVVRNRNKKALI